MVEFETLKFVAMLDQLVREGVGGCSAVEAIHAS